MRGALIPLLGALLAGCLPPPAWYSPDADLKALAGGALVRACRVGDPAACAELARLIQEAGPSDPARGAALYGLRVEACERGDDALACERLGHEHVYGDWPDLEPRRSHAALLAACQRGLSDACYIAGAAIEEGRPGPADERASFEIFRLGCTLDQPECCAYVGLKLEFGRGVPQDDPKAAWFYERACELGERKIGCFNHALRLANLPEDQVDLPRVLELMRGSCEAGTQTACENLRVLEAAR
ncbi:MAG: tetratricopeptide repeat protein [Pseudomonadota bacterium]